MADADIGVYFFAATILAIVLACVFMAVRYGSLRGAMFGARVLRELGEVSSGSGIFGRSAQARVFELEADGGKRVGLEVRRYGKRFHATLSAADAQRLARLLDSAAR